MQNNGHLPLSRPGPACATFADLLPLLGVSELEEPKATRLQTHLATCANCRTQQATYDRMDAVLRRAFAVPATLSLSPEDMMALTDTKEQRSGPPAPTAPAPLKSHPSRHARRVVSLLSAIAAVLVLALITTALFVSRHSPGLAANPKVTATATPALSAPSGVYFATTSFPPTTFSSGTVPGTIYALKAQDGSVHWQEHLSTSPMGRPVLSNGTFYLVAGDVQINVSVSYAVYAINASDGTIRWHTSIDAQAQWLQVADGVVYTGTTAGVIFALNASDGSIRWHTKVGNSGADVQQISNGVVYALVEGGPYTESGSLYALNTADGSVRWHAQPHGMPASIRVVGGQVDMVAIYSQDSSDVSTVYLTPTFYALDASTGAQRWSYAGSVSESMNMAGADANAVYLTTSQIGSSLTTLLALNAGDGSVRWQKSVTGQDLSASVAPDNTMYLAFQGGVSAVNLLDGSEIWNTALSGSPCLLRLLVDGTLYVTAGSTLFALDSSNGLVKWRYQAPSPGVHAAVNGVLFGSSVQVDIQQQSLQTSIFALDTSSGKQLWKYDIASQITVPVVG